MLLTYYLAVWPSKNLGCLYSKCLFFCNIGLLLQSLSALWRYNSLSTWFFLSHFPKLSAQHPLLSIITDVVFKDDDVGLVPNPQLGGPMATLFCPLPSDFSCLLPYLKKMFVAALLWSILIICTNHYNKHLLPDRSFYVIPAVLSSDSANPLLSYWSTHLQQCVPLIHMSFLFGTCTEWEVLRWLSCRLHLCMTCSD
jgi:hypothetical protein